MNTDRNDGQNRNGQTSRQLDRVPSKKSEKRSLSAVLGDAEAIEGFSRVNVAMVLTDPRVEDNPIIYVNEAFERTTGYARSAVIGRNCRFLQGEETRKDHVDKLRSAIEYEQNHSVDIQNYRADGKPFINRLTIAPILDDDGNTVFFLGIQKDLYESEREEAVADQMLTAIRSRVQSDLSLVLKSIGDMRGGMVDGYEAMARRMECLQLAYESILQSEDRGLGDDGVDLGALISRVCASIAHTEGRPGIRYQQNIDRAEVRLEAAVRIALLLSELLYNAFHHAFDRMDEGVIELRVTRLAAGGLRLIVTDDGVGLPSALPFPGTSTVGGRLIATLAEGLDASVTPVRGAAGTVMLLDVPAGILEP